MTCECLLSYMQALFVGDSYFFKRTRNNVERCKSYKVILRLQVLTTVLCSQWKLTSKLIAISLSTWKCLNQNTVFNEGLSKRVVLCIVFGGS